MRVTHCTRALLRAMADEMKAPASVEAEEPTVVTSLALQNDEPPPRSASIRQARAPHSAPRCAYAALARRPGGTTPSLAVRAPARLLHQALHSLWNRAGAAVKSHALLCVRVLRLR